jgi:hypothetical protein
MEDLYIAEPGKPEVKMGSGHDVAAAAAGGKLYLVYVKEGKAVLWSEGKTQEIGQDATFPTLTALPNGGLLAAWEQAGAITVKAVR